MAGGTCVQAKERAGVPGVVAPDNGGKVRSRKHVDPLVSVVEPCLGGSLDWRIWRRPKLAELQISRKPMDTGSLTALLAVG